MKCPRDVHLVDIGFAWPAVGVHEVDRVVASIAGEMPVVAAGITPLRRVYDLRHTFATFALRAGI